MAVYTPVDADQVAAFLGGYDLGRYVDHRGIVQGVENTNYHLFTDRGRFILTLFERRTNPDDLPFVFDFIDRLAGDGLPVPGLCRRVEGGRTGILAGRAAAIVQFLDGTGVEADAITPEVCAQVGAMLARMHLEGIGFDAVRVNPVGSGVWRALLKEALPGSVFEDDAVLRGLITEALDAYERAGADLPRGAVHADLFPDNVFFRDGVLSGVIDFYFACTDYLVYDLAIAVNAWCFDAQGRVVPARLEALARAYEAVRPLEAAERSAFAALRRAAALRIFATRLYDRAFTPAGADVVCKDPAEYARRLKEDCAWPL